MDAVKETRNTPSRSVDAELGQRAHMLIWSEGRKQGDVATKIGMSSGSLGLELKGQRGWALAEVKAIAAELNTTVAYLVGEIDNEAPVGPEAPASAVKSGRFGEVIGMFDRQVLVEAVA
jgi:hypothetical protein